MEVFYYTPGQLFKDSTEWVSQINRSQKFDVVLAIARGGIPVGTFLARALDIPMLTIHLSSYENKVQCDMKIVSEPNWDDLADKTILVVDDLIDNGCTIKFLHQLLSEKNITDHKTAVLIDKKKNPAIIPDYCAKIVSPDEWIEFFWEAGYYGKKK